MTQEKSRNKLYTSLPGLGQKKSKHKNHKDEDKDSSSAGLAMRKIALKCISQVFDDKKMLDKALNHEGKELSHRDQAFLKQLTTLYFKHRGNLRWILRQLMDRALPPKLIVVERLIELGLVQILFMRTADHAAVDQTVRLIGSRKDISERSLKGLANAVLRNAIRQRDTLLEKLSEEKMVNLPGWLRKRWLHNLGEDRTIKIAASLTRDAPIDLTIKDPNKTQYYSELFGAEILPTGSLRLPKPCDVTTLDGFESGDWWVQDIAAAIPAKLFGDIKGLTVADLCSAPGGKTMQLASMGAKVHSVDVSQRRMPRLWKNIQRTQLTDLVEPIVKDILEWRAEKSVSCILLDAPCSATGTLRRNPDSLWLKSAKQIRELAELQSQMLDHTFKQLPKGGVLIYCVCSMEQEEGPDQIRDFLARTPSAKLDPVTPEELGGMHDLCSDDGYLVCYPDLMEKNGGMDGFFAARIKKIG